MPTHSSVHSSNVSFHIHFITPWVTIHLQLYSISSDLHFHIPESFFGLMHHIDYLSVGSVSFVFLVHDDVLSIVSGCSRLSLNCWS